MRSCHNALATSEVVFVSLFDERNDSLSAALGPRNTPLQAIKSALTFRFQSELFNQELLAASGCRQRRPRQKPCLKARLLPIFCDLQGSGCATAALLNFRKLSLKGSGQPVECAAPIVLSVASLQVSQPKHPAAASFSQFLTTRFFPLFPRKVSL